MTTKSKRTGQALTAVKQTTFAADEHRNTPGRCPGCGSILVQTTSGTVCYEAAMGHCERTGIQPAFHPPHAGGDKLGRVARIQAFDWRVLWRSRMSVL